MTVDTWGTASNAHRRRQAKPITSTSEHHRDQARAQGMTPLQRDMETLRLDPFRPLDNTRHLQKVVGLRWPAIGADDNRPAGWGWEHQQAYARLWEHLSQQRPWRRQTSPLNPRWRR